MLEDRRDAPPVRALLGVDRERPRDDEAGVAGPALGLVGLEGLVGPARRDRPQRQHVGRAQPLQVAGQQVGFLDGQERREHAGDDPAALGDLLEALVDGLDGLVDRDRLEIVVLADVHRRQQVGVVGRLVAVPALVADPVIVDERIVAGLEPPECAAVLLGADVAAGRAARADRVVLREEPGPLLVQEIFVEQGADRAEVDDVAGQRVVDRLAGKDVDLGMVAAPHHLELAGLGDLAGEPDAPGAHDAAVHG